MRGIKNKKSAQVLLGRFLIAAANIVYNKISLPHSISPPNPDAGKPIFV